MKHFARRPRRFPRACLVCTLALLWTATMLPCAVAADEEAAAVEKRLADAARYLASDELEGRGQYRSHDLTQVCSSKMPHPAHNT